jgi:hypothetical protein
MECVYIISESDGGYSDYYFINIATCTTLEKAIDLVSFLLYKGQMSDRNNFMNSWELGDKFDFRDQYTGRFSINRYKISCIDEEESKNARKINNKPKDERKIGEDKEGLSESNDKEGLNESNDKEGLNELEDNENKEEEFEENNYNFKWVNDVLAIDASVHGWKFQGCDKRKEIEFVKSDKFLKYEKMINDVCNTKDSKKENE